MFCLVVKKKETSGFRSIEQPGVFFSLPGGMIFPPAGFPNQDRSIRCTERLLLRQRAVLPLQ